VLKTQHSKIEVTLKAAVFHPKYLSWRYIHEINKFKPLFDIPLAQYDTLEAYPASDDIKRALKAHLINHSDIPKKPTVGKPSQPGTAPTTAPTTASTTAPATASANTNVAQNKKRKREQKGNKDESKSSYSFPICPDCGKRHPGDCWVKYPEKMPQHIREQWEKKQIGKGNNAGQ